MNLTPLDVRRKQFDKGFRGYDPTEVDLFLKQVADRLEDIQDEARRAEERQREAEAKLVHYEKVELALQEALESARETARRSEASAEERARLIVQEAELRAEKILHDAESERHGLRQDLVRLNSRQAEVAARLRGFLLSELEVLAQFQGDDPVGFIKLQPAGGPGGMAGVLPSPQARLEAPIEPPSAPPEPRDEPVAPPTEPVAEMPPAEPVAEAPSASAEPEAGHRIIVTPAPAPTPSAEQAEVVDPSPPAPEPSPPPFVAEPGVGPESTAMPDSEPAWSAPPTPPFAPPVSPAPPPPPPPAPTPETPLNAPLESSSDTPLAGAYTSAEETSRPPAPEPATPEPAAPEPPPARTGGWDLRSLVTGEDRSVTASDEERERIRRILDDLD